MLPYTGIQANWAIHSNGHLRGATTRRAIGIHGGAHENLGLDDLNQRAVHELGHPFGQMTHFAGIVFTGASTSIPTSSSASWRRRRLAADVLERCDQLLGKPKPTRPAQRFPRSKPKEGCEYIARNVTPAASSSAAKAKSRYRPRLSDRQQTLGLLNDYPHEVNKEYCKHRDQRDLETKTSATPTKLLSCTATPSVVQSRRNGL